MIKKQIGKKKNNIFGSRGVVEIMKRRMVGDNLKMHVKSIKCLFSSLSHYKNTYPTFPKFLISSYLHHHQHVALSLSLLFKYLVVQHIIYMYIYIINNISIYKKFLHTLSFRCWHVEKNIENNNFFSFLLLISLTCQSFNGGAHYYVGKYCFIIIVY